MIFYIRRNLLGFTTEIEKNLTSPEGTILRSNNMVDGIDYLLKKHGDNLKILLEINIYILISPKVFICFCLIKKLSF